MKLPTENLSTCRSGLDCPNIITALKYKEVVERLRELLKGKTDDFAFFGRDLRKDILREEK